MAEEIKKEETVKSESKEETKFCVHCGKKIPIDAVICVKCGRQVSDLSNNKATEPVVITNNNTAVATVITGRKKDKWVAFVLCLLLGVFGVHKFYEEKVGLGILYLCTGGLCGIGVIIDLIIILCKPNPYYV